jgi:hypothetical protein
VSAHPPDPFRQIDVYCATYAEKYAGFVKTGMPPLGVLFMLGVEQGVFLAAVTAMAADDGQQQGQAGGTGAP